MGHDQAPPHYIPNAVELVMDHLPRSLRTPLILGSTAVATVMCGADLFIHADNGLSNPDQRQIAENWLGSSFTQNVGNSFFSFAITTGFMLGAELTRNIGTHLENQRLINLAHHLPLLGFATVAALNLLIEKTLNTNLEGAGDINFGLLSAINAVILSTALFSSIHSAHTRNTVAAPSAE